MLAIPVPLPNSKIFLPLNKGLLFTYSHNGNVDFHTLPLFVALNAYSLINISCNSHLIIMPT